MISLVTRRMDDFAIPGSAEESDYMSDTDHTLRRRTLAILLAAVAGIALAGCSLLPGNTVDSNVFTLVVGDCFNGDYEGGARAVTFVDCAEPHESEVYASIMMDGGDFPGEDAVLAQADTDCYAAYGSFVGLSWEESVLNFGVLFPSAESWALSDREILCIIYDPARTLTSGSLAGVAR